MLQYHAKGSVVNGGTQWFLMDYVPATSHNGTYTMIDAGSSSFADEAEFVSHYGFTRAICDSAYVPQFRSAGFSINQILVGIGFNNGGVATLDENWQNTVNCYGNQVLGYFIDEPSGDEGQGITDTYMQIVQTAVHAVGSKLWLDDYDTGVIGLPLAHGFHLINVPLIDHGDYIMCDADNSNWVSGVGGIGCYVGEDYDEFQTWFGGGSQPTFNTIFTMPTFDNRNVGSVMNWMDAHLGNNINTFALWLPANAWNWTEVEAFADSAYQAGFLGAQQELMQAQYTCQQNNVAFVPSGFDANYYGVLTDDWYYSGPVDPSLPGATLCWSTGWAPRCINTRLCTRTDVIKDQERTA